MSYNENLYNPLALLDEWQGRGTKEQEDEDEKDIIDPLEIVTDIEASRKPRPASVEDAGRPPSATETRELPAERQEPPAERPTEKPKYNPITDFMRTVQAQGALAAKGLNVGMATFSENLASLADYAEKKAPQEFKKATTLKGLAGEAWRKDVEKAVGGTVPDTSADAYKKAALFYHENADYWDKKAKEIGTTGVDRFLGETLGYAVPGVAEFMLNVPYWAALGAARAEARKESELWGGFTEGAKRLLLGRIFHQLGHFKQPLKSGGMGGVFAAQTAGEGGTPEDIKKALGTGILYGIATPGGGRIGPRELYGAVRSRLQGKPAKMHAARVKDYLNRGMSETEAETQAFNDIAETPAGQESITRAAEDSARVFMQAEANEARVRQSLYGKEALERELRGREARGEAERREKEEAPKRAEERIAEEWAAEETRREVEERIGKKDIREEDAAALMREEFPFEEPPRPERKKPPSQEQKGLEAKMHEFRERGFKTRGFETEAEAVEAPEGEIPAPPPKEAFGRPRAEAVKKGAEAIERKRSVKRRAEAQAAVERKTALQAFENVATEMSKRAKEAKGREVKPIEEPDIPPPPEKKPSEKLKPPAELKPSLKDAELINDVSRVEAGKLMARGDPSVIEHVRQGIKEGRDPGQIQDAIRNEMVSQVSKAPKGKARDEVRENIRALEPGINQAIRRVEPEAEVKKPRQQSIKLPRFTEDERWLMADGTRMYEGVKYDLPEGAPVYNMQERMAYTVKDGQLVPKEAMGLAAPSKKAVKPTARSIKEEQIPRGSIENELRTIGDTAMKEAETEAMTGAVTVPERAGRGRAPEVKHEFRDSELEKRWKDAEGIRGKEPLMSRVFDAMLRFKNQLARTYEHIPNTGEYAQLQFNLLKMSKQRGITGDKVVEQLRGIVKPLRRGEYKVFSRKVFMDNFAESVKRGDTLPFDLNESKVAQETTELNRLIESSPKIKQALDLRERMWQKQRDDYITAMGDIDIDVSKKMARKDYMRHQVLDYAELKRVASGVRGRRDPAKRSYLKTRRGSSKDINTDYLQAEFEVLAQMALDTEYARFLKYVEREFDISKQIKAEAKANGDAKNWEQYIPTTHEATQFREGHVFYLTDSIPAKFAQELLMHKELEIDMPTDVIQTARKALAMGRKHKQYVVPSEVARTLNELNKGMANDNIITRGVREATKVWKKWILLSPRRVGRFTLRNITGDADAAFAGNPKAFLHAPRAIKELYNVMVRRKSATPQLRRWLDRGGWHSSLQALEIGELQNLKEFVEYAERRTQSAPKQVALLPIDMFKSYWKNVRLASDFREAILRYSNFIEYERQMNKNPGGLPDNYGASRPDEIKALNDKSDRAYWLANDLLGAYDRIGKVGQHLRQYEYPFWSWKEANFKRYNQLLVNAFNEGNGAKGLSTLGRSVAGKALIRGPYRAYQAGKFLVMASGLWAGMQAWNHLKYPDEEMALSDDERATPHIILGSDENANVITFNRMGAFADYLSWLGLDAAPQYVSELFSGDRSPKDIAVEMAKAPVNIMAQGVTPFMKMPAELMTRRSLFPDITRPGTIRDRGYFIARSLGLKNEYAAIAELPSRGYEESLVEFLFYKRQPDEGAYFNTLDEKYRFLKDIGKASEGFWLTPRGHAAYNLKLSLRYNDKEAAQKYFDEYVLLGGTRSSLNQTIKSMHPLSGLNDRERKQFMDRLNKQEREDLKTAIEYYRSLIAKLQEYKSGR